MNVYICKKFKKINKIYSLTLYFTTAPSMTSIQLGWRNLRESIIRILTTNHSFKPSKRADNCLIKVIFQLYFIALISITVRPRNLSLPRINTQMLFTLLKCLFLYCLNKQNNKWLTGGCHGLPSQYKCRIF